MSYEDYLAGEPVVLTVALTGGVHGKEANPNLPETPAEVAAAAREAEEAGAAVAHLHARQDNGERAFSVERFQELTDAVRSATDLVIQHSTGGTGVPLEQRRQPLRTDPPPEMASLDMGPLNRYRHLTSENTRHTIDELAAEMAERGVKPELELFNNGHIGETRRLLEERPELLAEPLYATLIVGPGTLSPPDPRTFLTLVESLPEGALFNTLGFGRHQLPFAALGTLLGGHVRVGLEDNVYYRRGEPADSNAQLVKRVAGLARTLGREPATPDEARAVLAL